MKANKTQQAAMSAMRILVLFGIFSVAFIGLMAVPLDDSAWWMEQFLISKAFSAIAFYALHKLYNRWSKTDKWLKAYDKSCDTALKASNPCYLGKEVEDK